MTSNGDTYGREEESVLEKLFTLAEWTPSFRELDRTSVQCMTEAGTLGKYEDSIIPTYKYQTGFSNRNDLVA